MFRIKILLVVASIMFFGFTFANLSFAAVEDSSSYDEGAVDDSSSYDDEGAVESDAPSVAEDVQASNQDQSSDENTDSASEDSMSQLKEDDATDLGNQDDTYAEVAPKPSRTDKYITKSVLEQQKAEEEANNKALREKNVREEVYSEEMRAQNSSEADQLEEQILKEELNAKGIFLKNNKAVEKQLSAGAVEYDFKKESPSNLNIKEEPKNKDILNLRNPIFFVSEEINSYSYDNTMNVCSIVNFANMGVDCLVYPVEDKANIPHVLRRGKNSDSFKKLGVNADFMVTRYDAYLQYKKKRGFLASAPILNLLMYLNGDYLFMFANTTKNVFSFEQLAILKKNQTISIGYFGIQEKTIFDKVVLPMFSGVEYDYNLINLETMSYGELQETICYPNDMDIYISFGSRLPTQVQKAIESCSSQINPVTFSDETLEKVIATSSIFSIANVVGYYPAGTVLNYLDIYIALGDSYKENLEQKKKSKVKKVEKKQIPAVITPTATDTQTKTVTKASSTTSKPPRSKQSARATMATDRNPGLEARRKRAEQLKKQLAQANAEMVAKKSKAPSVKIPSMTPVSTEPVRKADDNYYTQGELVFKEKNINKVIGKSNSYQVTSNKAVLDASTFIPNTKKPYITSDTAVKTFGVRYVVLASRYAKRDNILKVFDSIVKDYFLIRNNILTPDMSKFSIADIISGTSSSKGRNEYHPALLVYPNYLLENKTKKTLEQTLVLKILNSNTSGIGYPRQYGPKAPNKKQIDVIYSKTRELNKKKEELALIRIYQRDMLDIDTALSDMKNGKNISDSLLKATGLDFLNVIYDETSVIDQGVIGDDQLTSDVNTSIDQAKKDMQKLDGAPTATDIQNSVTNVKKTEDITKKESGSASTTPSTAVVDQTKDKKEEASPSTVAADTKPSDKK